MIHNDFDTQIQCEEIMITLTTHCLWCGEPLNESQQLTGFCDLDTCGAAFQEQQDGLQ